MQAANIQGYRLSSQQRRLWFLQQSDKTQAYRITAAFDLTGKIEPETLNQALQQVVAQHEILRTTFQSLPGMTIPVQVIADEGFVSLETYCLRDLEATEQAVRIEAIFHSAKAHPFEYSKQPLFHTVLITLDDDAHVLIFSLPALSADLPSIGYIAKATLRDYTALVSGQQSAAKETMQYADFAEWQYDLQHPGSGSSAIAPWNVFDSNISRAQRLGFERRGSKSFQLASIDVALPKEILTNNQQISARGLLLGCWQTLLWRLMGSDRVITGIEFDGRKIEELKDAIGPISRYLPIQVNPTGESRFIDFVSQLDDDLTEAERWQEFFSQREDDNGTLFPFCFEWRVAPSDFLGDRLRLSVRHIDAAAEPFKLKLLCEVRDNKVTASLQYDQERFSSADMDRLARQLETIIESALSTPETKLSELRIIDDTEQRLLLEEFNRTEREFPTGICVHDLFAKQASEFPDRIAVTYEGQQLTYAQLNAKADQLAKHLQEIGVGPESIVGLYVERSLDFIVGLLGILKAGGAYLPLDNTQPVKRLEMMLTDARASLVLTSRSMAALRLDISIKVVMLDSIRTGISAELAAEVSDTNLAYVIFTSGSTGEPKAVAIEHRQLVNYVNAVSEQLNLPANSSFGLISTIAADLGNTTLFPSLLKGGTLHLISDEKARSPEALAAYCRENPLDCLKIVPSHLEALLAATDAGSIIPRRWLVLGGEACSWSLVEKIRLLAPQCRILNHYGPTETTVGVTTYLIGDETQGTGTVPLGRPLGNTQTYIVDQNLRLVPLGASGELCISGAGVARGYLNSCSATAERFVTNPFTATGAGARLYKTGDLARYRSDGAIEFLGRIDDQVKIHGHRIEPAETEAALRKHSALNASTVVVQSDEGGAKRLIAYVVSRNSKINGNELKTFLKTMLPDYLIPAAFVFLEQLPLTSNGKIDRQKLPAPDLFAESRRPYQAPRDDVEDRMARIWADVLKVDQVSVHDNFFELGGDSIKSIQIIARANQAGLRITPRQLFQHQTIAGLAAVAVTEPVRGKTPDDGLEEAVRPGLSREDIDSVLAKLKQMN